jgi:exonuclease VII large subunit
LKQWQQRLHNQHPERRLLQQSQQLDALIERLPRAWAQQRHGLRFQQIHNRWRVPTLPHAALQLQSQRLNAFSPQAVLERGYVRVEGAGGQTVSRRAQALLDQSLTLYFADGALEVVCRP